MNLFLFILYLGVWTNKNELKYYRNRTDHKFIPNNKDNFTNEYKYIRWLYNQKCLY